MSAHERFHFKDKEDLLARIRELELDIPFSEDLSVLFQDLTIAGKRTPNRFVVHPMEGCDADHDGTPQELAFRRYKRFATGGSGIIWFEATAVVREGRSNPRQFLITRKNANVFKNLVKETREAAIGVFGDAHRPVLILQLTHSGRYSRPDGSPRPIIVHHSPILDAKLKLSENHPLLTDAELDTLQEAYVDAAELAADAGFDGVDIKACHGYLVSELLAAYTRMDSRYGGSYNNRIRFLLEVAQKIKKRVPEIFVTSRLNVYDSVAYPYGFGVNREDCAETDLSEPKFLITALAEHGFPLINISIGNPYYLPHYGRPYDFPISGMQVPEENPLVSVARLISIVSDLQRAVPHLPFVGTGYSWLRHFSPYVAAAVIQSGQAKLVGQGRGALAYPDSVIDLAEKGIMDPHKVCITCSRCSQLMRDGGRTGCVSRDRKIYGLEYRNARMKAVKNLTKEKK